MDGRTFGVIYEERGETRRQEKMDRGCDENGEQAPKDADRRFHRVNKFS